MGKKLSFAPEQTPLFSQHTRLLQLCACEWESIIVVSIWINRISTHSRKYTHTQRQLHLKKRDDDDNDACKHTAFPAFSWEEEALFFFRTFETMATGNRVRRLGRIWGLFNISGEIDGNWSRLNDCARAAVNEKWHSWPWRRGGEVLTSDARDRRVSRLEFYFFFVLLALLNFFGNVLNGVGGGFNAGFGSGVRSISMRCDGWWLMTPG